MMSMNHCDRQSSSSVGNSQRDEHARLRPTALSAVLCFAVLAAQALTPLAAQQAPTDSPDISVKPNTSNDNAPSGPVLLDWIPAITIQAGEIDLLVENQLNKQFSMASRDGLPAAMQFSGKRDTGMAANSTLMQPGQLILRLLPDTDSGSGGSKSAAFSWSLLGDNADQPSSLIMRSARSNNYTSITGNAARSQNSGALLMRQDDTFAPQLNLGWQLGMQAYTTTTGASSYSGTTNRQQMAANGNMTLASIQCAESVLTSSSYSASGCHFTQVNQQQLLVGLDWNPLPGLSTTAGFFESSQASLPGWEQYSIGAGNLAAANYGKASTSDLLAVSGQQVRGMQIGLQLELLSGNNNLDISAGWSRITDFELDAPFLNAAAGQIGTFNQGSMLQTLGLTELSAVNSFNSSGRFASNETLDAATLQINWTNGDFSSGLESVYQQTPLLPGIQRGDDLTTFNLHFTWHTPWRGALSVGANNVLDTTGNGAAELTGEDALNSIYGRIPYVRYKQDL
jgi:hypothetical protein